ncbi:MAG TPA: hypothetical protein VIX86_22005, partial [Streptosporangiaceae bacterium]
TAGAHAARASAMTTPQQPAEPEIQAAVALADTPTGQKVAIIITVLLGKDNATQMADAIKATARNLSATGRLYVPNGQTPAPPPPGGPR